MTDKEKYIMGRAEFLADETGCSLTKGTEIAIKEYEANEKGWTVVYTPWEDLDGKERVAGRFKTTKEKNEFIEKIYKSGSGWDEDELHSLRVINDYNYILPQ